MSWWRRPSRDCGPGPCAAGPLRSARCSQKHCLISRNGAEAPLAERANRAGSGQEDAATQPSVTGAESAIEPTGNPRSSQDSRNAVATISWNPVYGSALVRPWCAGAGACCLAIPGESGDKGAAGPESWPTGGHGYSAGGHAALTFFTHAACCSSCSVLAGITKVGRICHRPASSSSAVGSHAKTCPGGITRSACRIARVGGGIPQAALTIRPAAALPRRGRCGCSRRAGAGGRRRGSPRWRSPAQPAITMSSLSATAQVNYPAGYSSGAGLQ
jgi:hypothetical protein